MTRRPAWTEAMIMLEAHLRRAATLLLEAAIRIAPADTRDWGQAMLGELIYIEGPWAALAWALGGAGVLAKQPSYLFSSLVAPAQPSHPTEDSSPRRFPCAPLPGVS